MKKKQFLGFILSFLLTATAVCQHPDFCTKITNVLRKIQEQHVRPRELNDQFFKDVKRETLIGLDDQMLIFLDSDLTIDLSAQTVSHSPADLCKELESITNLYEIRLRQIRNQIDKKLSGPLSFADNEAVPNKEPEKFAGKEEWEDRWKKFLKLAVMQKMHSLRNLAETPRKLIEYEEEARNFIRQRELQNIDQTLGTKEILGSHVGNAFARGMVKIFDPHSDFFNSEEVEEFESALSGKESSFGFTYSKDKGHIKIDNVMPGGPAWNSNKIHIEDVILQAREPEGKFIDVEDEQLIEKWKSDQVELKIKKPDGTELIVALAKEKVESVENRVQGFLLSGERQIGYVALPSFYRDWEGEHSASSCSEDLAKEIIKMKAEGIAGLILDLRYNGGGSMQEAIELAGIFIDFGPIALLRNKDNKISILKDMTRGTIYDGPLVILVNGGSASASELVAATLQDYKRAIIVGSTTFGKATSQVIMPVDEVSDDFVKLTVERVYRITGSSYQGVGVIPDIELPDLINQFIIREKDRPHSLKADSITKKIVYQGYPGAAMPILRRASAERVLLQEWEKKINEVSEFYKKPIPLEINSYEKRMQELEEFSKQANFKSGMTLKVKSTRFDQQLFMMDAFRKNLSDKLLKEISESPYINESCQILSDIIKNRK